jgi:hypothetical protein
MNEDRAVRLATIRSLISNARREINRNNPARARELIRTAYQTSEDILGTVEWVDVALTLAETFLAELRIEAEPYFNEALNRLKLITDPPPELRIRACERFAHFLVSIAKRPLKARRFCEEAKALAVQHGFLEDSARSQLRLLGIDLEADKDPQYRNFQCLVRVANDSGFTSQETLAAWMLHEGALEDEKKKGLCYARNANRVQGSYFQVLLNKARNVSNSEQLGLNR